MSKWSRALKRVMNSDAWENVVTLLGTSYDKSTYHRVYPETWYGCDELEDLYYGDSYARRIVEEPVDAAFRQGFELSVDDMLDPEIFAEDQAVLWQLFDSIGLVPAYKEALYWGRLYGRGGLLLGLEDGTTDLSEPLNVDRISEFKYVEVLQCTDFSVVDVYDDPADDMFGLPKTWLVTRSSSTSSSQVLVHESRILLTRGVPTSRRKRSENDWRDASVLQGPYKYLRNWDAANQGAANMMTDSSQAVLKIQRFSELIASEDISVFTNRMRVMEMARSLRILPIDADLEDFSYVERGFSGVFELIDRAAQILAGAAGMPQTILFGRSPAGMNATGEADIRGWYDQVQAQQSNTYQPGLELVVQHAARALDLGDPESWHVTWDSLWQESGKEKADREKVIADTDQIYLNMGAVTEEEIAETRFGGDEFNAGVLQIDLEQREALNGMDREPPVDVDLEAPGAEPLAEAVDPQTALNGAQVKSLMEIVLAVATRQIPRETGVSLIAAAFPLDRAQAELTMGPVGDTFFIEGQESTDEPDTSGLGQSGDDGDSDDGSSGSDS